MIKVLGVTVEAMENAGCNNGNYPHVEIELSNGETLRGYTCRCGRGCSNTWRLPDVGAQFDSTDELYRFLRNEPPIEDWQAERYVRLIQQWCEERHDGCSGCPFNDGGCVLANRAPFAWEIPEQSNCYHVPRTRKKEG